MDLDPGSIESVKAERFGQIFEDGNFVSGTTGADNNWAKGYFTDGDKLCEE